MHDIILEANDIKNVAQDISLASRIIRKLEYHYPGHLWAVNFDEDGGVARIVCHTVQHPLFTNFMYAYDLYLTRFDTDPDLKCVMRAGGEILERARLDRAGWNGDVPTFVEGVNPKHQPILGADGVPIL